MLAITEVYMAVDQKCLNHQMCLIVIFLNCYRCWKFSTSKISTQLSASDNLCFSSSRQQDNVEVMPKLCCMSCFVLSSNGGMKNCMQNSELNFFSHTTGKLKEQRFFFFLPNWYINFQALNLCILEWGSDSFIYTSKWVKITSDSVCHSKIFTYSSW